MSIAICVNEDTGEVSVGLVYVAETPLADVLQAVLDEAGAAPVSADIVAFGESPPRRVGRIKVGRAPNGEAILLGLVMGGQDAVAEILDALL